MDVLFLITARGGSKGVPGKNLRAIRGLSLLGYKAVSAKQSRYCGRLVISTDSPAIEAEATRFGVEVPFRRPAHLAEDQASSASVIAHAVEWFEQHDRAYDAILLLEPSSPFAGPADYDAAIELMARNSASLVVGMRQVEVASRYIGNMGQNGCIKPILEKMQRYANLGRHASAPEFTMNGALYLFRWNMFKSTGSVYGDPERSYGYVMDRACSVEIDEPLDLKWARFLVDHKIVDVSTWKEYVS